MKLHTDTLTYGDVWDAARGLGLFLDVLTEHGSRSRDHAFEVTLSGSSSRKSQAGNGDYPAATWDEWGALMGALYLIDPKAIWGSAKGWGYKDAADFNRQTQWRFSEGIVPADTHQQHRWQYDHATSSPLSDIARHYCTKCSARMERG